MVHECIHEEQIQGQSRTIERLDAELSYKKERLDDLKEDNRRMEKKIDDLSKNITDFITDSNQNDFELNNRLTKIETKIDEQDKAIKENKQESRDKFQKLALVVSIVVAVIAIMNFILPLMR